MLEATPKSQINCLVRVWSDKVLQHCIYTNTHKIIPAFHTASVLSRFDWKFRFVAGSAEDYLVRFDVSDEGDSIARVTLEGDDIKGVAAVKFRSDGKIIVCGCWDSRF